MTFGELYEKSGFKSALQFANYLNIPPRTVQLWVKGERVAPQYVTDLIEYKLIHEGIITNE